MASDSVCAGRFELRDGRGVLIRRAVPRDAAAVSRHIGRLLDEDGAYLTSSDAVPGIEALEEQLRRESAFEEGVTLAAFDASRGEDSCLEVVGVVTVSRWTRRKLRHVAVLGISELRAWRGAGLGRELCERGLAWSRERPEVSRVELSVMASNAAAVGLFESLGFGLEGRRPGRFLIDDGTFEDELVYGLSVRSGLDLDDGMRVAGRVAPASG
ncbi:MAG: GNAT family protein [Planctomycetota bacterium]